MAGPAPRLEMIWNPDTCSPPRPRALLFLYSPGGCESVSELSTHGATRGCVGNAKSESASTPGSLARRIPVPETGLSGLWVSTASFVVDDVSGLFWTEGLTN